MNPSWTTRCFKSYSRYFWQMQVHESISFFQPKLTWIFVQLASVTRRPQMWAMCAQFVSAVSHIHQMILFILSMKKLRLSLFFFTCHIHFSILFAAVQRHDIFYLFFGQSTQNVIHYIPEQCFTNTRCVFYCMILSCSVFCNPMAICSTCGTRFTVHTGRSIPKASPQQQLLQQPTTDTISASSQHPSLPAAPPRPLMAFGRGHKS
jgi:hypothetical protein